jgi:hypothetical protein
MTDKKSVLVIGIEPTLIDFSHPDFAGSGMDAKKILSGLKSSQDELTHRGYDVEMCLIDFGETAKDVILTRLNQKQFDCILIGAGIRVMPSNFILFEKLINLLHKHAPQSIICFNTQPSDTAESVERWI